MGPQLFLMLLCIQINSLAIMQHAVPHFPVYLDHNMTLNSFPLPPSQTTLQKHKRFAYVIELKEKPQVLATSLPSYALLSSTHWHILEDAAQLAFSLFKISNNGEFIDAPLCSALVITFPSKIYFTWYIFGGSNIKSKKLDLAMQNWKALC